METVTAYGTPQLQNGVFAIPGSASAATFTLTPTLPSGATSYSMKVTSTVGTTTTNLGTFAVPSGEIDIYGGPGTDSLTLYGTTSSDAFTAGSGTISEVAAENTADATSFTIGLNAVTALTLNGDGGSDSLTGPNQTNAWAITGANSGTLDSTTFFTKIDNLVGSSGNNTFAFATGGSLTGTVTGGSGSNTLDFSAQSAAVTVTIVAGGTNKATGTGGWTNIQTIIGGSAATNTLVGGAITNVWNISEANAGTLNGSLNFSSFQYLTGGSTNDTFNFLPGGSITGNLNGKAPVNTVDYAAFGTPATVNLNTNTATAIGGTWANIQSFIGTNTSDTLIGTNAASTWSITGTNSGTVGSYTFSAFPDLEGGTGTNNFKFVSPGMLTGTITGGSGTDNTITGDNNGDTFYVSGSNLGWIATILSGAFTEIQNLTGGSGNNTYEFENNGSINDISGGSGTNTLLYAGYVVPATVNLAAKSATGISAWTSLQNFVGTNGGTLIGLNGTNTWSITGTNGTNSGTIGAYSFAGFPNLTGGTGNNTYTFAAGATESGDIEGGGGANNTLNFSGYNSPVTINLQSTTATGIGGTWANIETFDGTDTTDTFIATNGTTNTWSLKGSNAGTVDGDTFTGFASLVGGSGNDVLNLANGATVSGSINGEGGSNSLNYSNTSTTGVTVNLGSATTGLANNSATGIDSGAANGISNIANVSVSAGNNYLTAVGVASSITFTAAGNGNNILVGGSGTNTLTVSGSGDNIVIGDHGNSAIDGGTGYNLLIGGYTDYDGNNANLEGIQSIWDTVKSTATFTTAVNNLKTSATYALTAATVFSNSNDTITVGTHKLDWYFAKAVSEIGGEESGDVTTLC
jgi:hypothetical protein